MSQADIIEQELCPVNELAENNSMKECSVRLDENTTIQVLVVKSNNKLSCLAARCTHYSVPLRMGVEDYPGPDCLPKFNIYTKNEIIYIKAAR